MDGGYGAGGGADVDYEGGGFAGGETFISMLGRDR